MSLRPTPGGEVPAATAALARAAFPKGNHCLVLRDALGPIFEDERFEGLFAACGRPAECPWRLALVTLLQFGPGSLGPPRCGCRARTHRLEVSPRAGVDRPRLRRLGAERAQALGSWPPAQPSSRLCRHPRRPVSSWPAPGITAQPWSARPPKTTSGRGATCRGVHARGLRPRLGPAGRHLPGGPRVRSWSDERDERDEERTVVRIRFSTTQCKACPSKPRERRGARRILTPRPRKEHETPSARRERVCMSRRSSPTGGGAPASRARCPWACAPWVCVAPAPSAWPKRIFSISSPRPRSTSCASPPEWRTPPGPKPDDPRSPAS